MSWPCFDDFDDKFRDEYSKSVPQASGFYTSYSGYMDELLWAAAWLLRDSGDEKYIKKYLIKLLKLNMENKIPKDFMEIQVQFLGMIKYLENMH